MAPISGPGFPWFAVGIKEDALSEATVELMAGGLYYPSERKRWPFDLPMTTLSQVAAIGPTHDRIGHPRGGDGRGAFTFDRVATAEVSVYPSLWAADSKVQKRILTVPTHSGRPATRNEIELQQMLAQKSDLLISTNLRMTSQALSAAQTDSPVMGGNAWTTLQCDDASVKSALAIWLNSTLSMMIQTAYCQTTQPGRALMKIGALGGFPVPDFAARGKAGQQARRVARQRIGELQGLELQPISYAFRDDNRHRIDEAALEMVGLGGNAEAGRAVEFLRRLWCREPAVHGGNKTLLRALGLPV